MRSWLHPLRWLRFSLRSLLLLTALIALVTARWVNRARDQQAAIAVLKQHYPRSLTRYDYEHEPYRRTWAESRDDRLSLPPFAPPLKEPAVWVPDFLRQRLGPDYFFDLASVRILESSEELTAEVRSALSRLTTLRELQVHCPVHDEDVLALTARSPLTQLHLTSSSQLTDKSLPAIARLRGIEELILCGAPYSAEALGQLSRLGNLRQLHLVRDFFGTHVSETDFTDEHLAEIARLDTLEYLVLHSGRVTDAGLAELRRLKELRALFITAKLPTGEALAELAALSKMSSLILDLPRATTETLTTHLPRLARLKNLTIYSDVCDQNALQKSLPVVRVNVFPSDWNR